MRLGPLTIGRYRAADTPREGDRPPRPKLGVAGAGGTTLFSGMLSGIDYNRDLDWPQNIAVWERIFKSDGTARAVERAVTLPIRATQMGVEPPTDTPRDREIAERAEAALRGMARSWENVLWHQLLYLRYGFYLLEIVWTQRGGLYTFEDLAPRPPKTVHRWYTDERGSLAGIQQRVWTPSNAGFGALATGEYKYLDIEAARLLHLVNEGEAGNFAGESIARPMYKHWKMADTIERIAAIGVERREIGTEYAHMSQEAQQADVDAVAAALASLHAQEKGYIVFPPTVSDKGIFGQGEGRSTTMELIAHHKREMTRSYMTEFLSMGSGGTGSYAQHRDKSAFFLLALKAVADYIADTNSRCLIRPFVDLNFGPQAEYPRLNFGRLDTRNIAEYAQAIMQLVNAGALTVERTLEEALRNDLDLPDLPEDGEIHPQPVVTPGGGGAEMRPRSAQDRPPQPPPDGRPAPARQNARAYARRELRPAEKAVDYAGLAGRLDAARQSILRASAAVQRRQIAAIVEVVRGIVQEGAPARLERLDLPYANELAGIITAQLVDLYDYGKGQARRELGLSGSRQPKEAGMALDPADVDEVLAYLAARGKSITQVMAAKIRSAVTLEALRQIRLGEFDADGLIETLTELSTRELTLAARAAASESLSLGRAATFELIRDEIAWVELSSVLDETSCSTCEGLDGSRYQVATAAYEQHRPPLRDCFGGDLCRCIYVAVLKEETQ
jgi:hypothetical protein